MTLSTAPSVDDETRIAEVAGYLNVFQAELVVLVHRAIRSGSWTGHGIHSVAQWLAIQTGCSPATAARIVDVADRVDDFPCIIGEFTSGRLSLDQTHVVVTRAPPWADAKVVDFATAATVRQLERTMREQFFRGPEEPDSNRADQPADQGDGSTADGADDAADCHADQCDADECDAENCVAADCVADAEGTEHPAVDRPHHELEDTAEAADAARVERFPFPSDRLTFGWRDGRFVGSFDLSADHGAVLEAALQEARDALFREGVTDLTWVDALVEIALRSLDHATPARQSLFKVMLHVDVDDPRGAARFSNGRNLPEAITDYLTCTADQQPVWQSDHRPLGLGRTQRVAPLYMRRLLEFRDQGCRVPGCDNTHVELHHIIHWRHGGPTDASNLVSLCTRHHRLHHQGLIVITGDANVPPGEADTVVFRDRAGNTIQTTPRPVPPAEPPPDPPPGYRHPSGERLDLRYFAGWNHPSIRNRHPATWKRKQSGGDAEERPAA